MSLQSKAKELCESIKIQEADILPKIQNFFLPITNRKAKNDEKLNQKYGIISIRLLQAIISSFSAKHKAKGSDVELIKCAKTCFSIAFQLEQYVTLKTKFTIELMYQKFISVLLERSKFNYALECISDLVQKLTKNEENCKNHSNLEDKLFAVGLPNKEEDKQMIQIVVFCIYNGARCFVELGKPNEALKIGNEKLWLWLEELDMKDTKSKKQAFCKCSFSLFYYHCAGRLESSSPIGSFLSKKLGLKIAGLCEGICDKKDYLSRCFKNGVQLQKSNMKRETIYNELIAFYSDVWKIMKLPQLKLLPSICLEEDRSQSLLLGSLDQVEFTLWVEHFAIICQQNGFVELAGEISMAAGAYLTTADNGQTDEVLNPLCIGLVNLQSALIQEKQVNSVKASSLSAAEWKKLVNHLYLFVTGLKDYCSTTFHSEPENERLTERVIRAIDKMQVFLKLRCGQKVRDALCKLCLKAAKLSSGLFSVKSGSTIVCILRNCAESLPDSFMDEKYHLLEVASNCAVSSSQLLHSIATSSYNIGAILFNQTTFDFAAKYLILSCNLLEKNTGQLLEGSQEQINNLSQPMTKAFKPDRWQVLATCFNKLNRYLEAQRAWVKSLLLNFLTGEKLDLRSIDGFAESTVNILSAAPQKEQTCPKCLLQVLFDWSNNSNMHLGQTLKSGIKNNISTCLQQECEAYERLFTSKANRNPQDELDLEKLQDNALCYTEKLIENILNRSNRCCKERFFIRMDAVRFAWNRYRYYDSTKQLEKGKQHLRFAKDLARKSSSFEFFLMKLMVMSWELIFDSAVANFDVSTEKNKHVSNCAITSETNLSELLHGCRENINIDKKQSFVIEDCFINRYLCDIAYILDWFEMFGYHQMCTELLKILLILSSSSESPHFDELQNQTLYYATAAVKSHVQQGKTKLVRDILSNAAKVPGEVNQRHPELTLLYAEIETLYPYSWSYVNYEDGINAIVNDDKMCMNEVGVEAKSVRSDLNTLQMRPVNALHDAIGALKSFQKGEQGYRDHVETMLTVKRTEWKRLNTFLKCLMQLGRMWEDRGDPRSARYYYDQGLQVAKRVNASLRVREFDCFRVRLAVRCRKKDLVQSIASQYSGNKIENEDVDSLSIQTLFWKTALAEKALLDQDFDLVVDTVEHIEASLNKLSVSSEEDDSYNSWMQTIYSKAIGRMSMEKTLSDIEELEDIFSKTSLNERSYTLIAVRLRIQLKCIKGDALYSKSKSSNCKRTIKEAIQCYESCFASSSNIPNRNFASSIRCRAMLGFTRSHYLLNNFKSKEILKVTNVGIALSRKLCDPTLAKAFIQLVAEVSGEPDLFHQSFGTSICLARSKQIEDACVSNIDDVDIPRCLSSKLEMEARKTLESCSGVTNVPHQGKLTLDSLFWTLYSPLVPVENASKILRYAIDEFLPETWVTCSLSTCVNKESILILRESGGGRKPVFVAKKVEGLKQDIETLELLISQCEKTTKGMTADVAKGLSKKQKLEWWSHRENLNNKLCEMLLNIEESWLGVFKVVLCPPPLLESEESERLNDLIFSCMKLCCENDKTFKSAGSESTMAARLRLVIEGADVLGFDYDAMMRAILDVVEINEASWLEELVCLILEKHPLKRDSKAKPEKTQCIDLTCDSDEDMKVEYAPLSKSPRKMKVKELKEALSERGLSTTGLKRILLERLEDAVALERIQSNDEIGKDVSSNDSSCGDLPNDRNENSISRHNLILILPGELQKISFESLPMLSSVPTTRMPAISFILEHAIRNRVVVLKANKQVSSDVGLCCKGGTFFVNPQGDLSNTSNVFSPILKQLEERYLWKGLVNQRPTNQDFQAGLEQSDIFLYCGHGTAEEFLTREKISNINSKKNVRECATTLLMGCSSGKLQDYGDFEHSGIIWSYILAGSKSVVCCLWDVTDKDIDRYTIKLLEDWIIDGKTDMLAQAVSNARGACKLRYLVGAAPVCYGVPTQIVMR